MENLRVCVWSGPRNVSTALMYSFAQRSDTRVIDEPLYGHYLSVTGADHPGREEIMASMTCDAAKVVQETILGPCDRSVLFMKSMTHHLVDMDLEFLGRTVNILLIRDPREVLLSLAKVLKHPTAHDTGIKQQKDLLLRLEELGQRPPLVDARQLLDDPRGVLTGLCRRLGLGFQDSMLGWRAGPHAEDGVWAKHWYSNAHRSTGFHPHRVRDEAMPAELLGVEEECRPYYRALLEKTVGTTITM